jgi:hypothetical protein
LAHTPAPNPMLQHLKHAPAFLQGGSDISGTLSKLHCHIKKNICLKFFFPKIILAVCRSINKKKKTLSSKDVLTGSFKSRDSLRTSRRTYHKEIMSYGKTKRALFTMLKKSLKN